MGNKNKTPEESTLNDFSNIIGIVAGGIGIFFSSFLKFLKTTNNKKVLLKLKKIINTRLKEIRLGEH